MSPPCSQANLISTASDMLPPPRKRCAVGVSAIEPLPRDALRATGRRTDGVVGSCALGSAGPAGPCTPLPVCCAVSRPCCCCCCCNCCCCCCSDVCDAAGSHIWAAAANGEALLSAAGCFEVIAIRTKCIRGSSARDFSSLQTKQTGRAHAFNGQGQKENRQCGSRGTKRAGRTKLGG